MNIKLQLLKRHIADIVEKKLENFEIDSDKIADSVAITVLSEVQNIIANENDSDFEVVEKIVCVFEKYGINYGSRHDF